MQAILQSPFLQSLGYAIADSFWQMAVLWAIVILINGCICTTAATRYRVAIAAQFTGFIWFVVTLWLHEPMFSIFHFPFSTLNLDISITPLQFASLSIVYLLLLVFFFLRWMYSFYYTHRIKHSGLQKIDAHWRLFIEEYAQRFSLPRKVAVYLSSMVKTPITIGFFKPVILIPPASINHLSTEQMEAVILHELAHIKRADYFLNLLQTIVEVVLFFNPFTRLLGKMIREERENCCDDHVLQYHYGALLYAEALLNIASLQRLPVLVMPVANRKNELLFRVSRILHPQNEYTILKHASLSVVALLLAVVVVFFSVKHSAPTVTMSMENAIVKTIRDNKFVQVNDVSDAVKVRSTISTATLEQLQQNDADDADVVEETYADIVSLYQLQKFSDALQDSSVTILINKLAMQSNVPAKNNWTYMPASFVQKEQDILGDFASSNDYNGNIQAIVFSDAYVLIYENTCLILHNDKSAKNTAELAEQQVSITKTQSDDGKELTIVEIGNNNDTEL